MSSPQSPLLRFGNFELDTGRCELRKYGIKIKLQRKPFQVLSLLLERRGDVVSRDELQRSLWPDGVFVDFDHSLNTAIKKLRDALGDTAATPRYIATIDRRGYRFTADVQEIELPVRASAPPPVGAPPPAQMLPPEKPRPVKRWPYWTAAATLVILIVGGYFGWRFLHDRARVGNRRVMLAVLPFENLTGDTAQDYFSDGLTEEMISQIGSIDPQRLGLIARTSAMHYKHTQEPLDQIGRKLGVSYILEGSVRRDAGRVRISAQLIAVHDQSHVWAKEYDRELNQLLSVQEEIAQQIAHEIELTFGAQSQATNKPVVATSVVVSYEAYDLYLKGLYFWNKRDKGFPQAAEYFQQAIDKAPNYARAYAALANNYALMSTWYAGRPDELMPKARAAAQKALEINPSLAEAHTALALVMEMYDYDWPGAEREFRYAIQLDPGYATAHEWYGEFLSYQGRLDEGLAEGERARQLDPLSLIIASDYAAILLRARKYDRAIEQDRAILDMDPTFIQVCGGLVVSYSRTGRFSDALQVVNRYVRPDSENWASVYEAVAYAEWGKDKEAERAGARVVCDQNEGYCIEALLPAYSAMGKKDQAMALLEKAFSNHSPIIAGIKTEPTYDPLRSDPRFQDLLRRVHLDN